MPELGKFDPILEQAKNRSIWISVVLNQYLRKPAQPASVIAALAIGDGMELLHLRPFVGPQALIHGFDIVPPEELPHGADIIAYTSSLSHQADIQSVGEVQSVLKVVPDIIICRHPRLFESVSRDSNEIMWNEWWINALTEYAKWISGRGQMMITTFFKLEALKFIEGMTNQGIIPKYYENEFCPLVTNFRTKVGSLKGRPDGYVLLI